MRFLITLAVLLSVYLTLAQENLITRSDLAFASDYESDYFDRLLSGEDVSLELMLAMTIKDDKKIGLFRQHFDQHLNEIKALKRDKKDEKYVKKVYEELHDRFLRKYENLVNFEKVFSTGVYNCVTACAIYGLSFDLLGIPYVIKETPNHVYLLAYPGEDEIVIETTDPVGGFKSFSPNFKSAFIQTLQQQKLIDVTELGDGVNSLFQKYYYNGQGLAIKELLALHYYNYGISFYSESDYFSALKALEKAYFIYPSERIKLNLFISYGQIIARANYDSMEEVEVLIKLANMEGFDVADSDVLVEYSRIIQNRLIAKYDTTFMRTAFEKISEKVTDEELVDEIGFIHHYEMGRVAFNRGLFSDALAHGLEAYQIQPNNLEGENLVLACFVNANIDGNSERVLEDLKALMAEYPNLISNQKVGAIYLNLHLYSMYEYLEAKQVTKALEMKDAFEKALDENTGYKYEEELVGGAYSQLAAYYFRRGYTSSAKKVINKGLSLAPGNSELRMRQYMISN